MNVANRNSDNDKRVQRRENSEARIFDRERLEPEGLYPEIQRWFELFQEAECEIFESQ